MSYKFWNIALVDHAEALAFLEGSIVQKFRPPSYLFRREFLKMCRDLSLVTFYVLCGSCYGRFHKFVHCFCKIALSHIKQHGNLVVHALARYAAQVTGCLVWIEEPPYLYVLYCQML